MSSRTYQNENRQLQYLYTVARHLCSQYCRDRMVTAGLLAVTCSICPRLTYSLVQVFGRTIDEQMTEEIIAAGLTWILTAALIVIMSVLIPFSPIFSMAVPPVF